MKKIVIAILAFVLLLSACSDANDYVATVGKQSISENELEFYLKNVKSQMQGTELSSDEDWKDHEIEGRKAIEIAKEKAYDLLVKTEIATEDACRIEHVISEESFAAIKTHIEQYNSK